MMIMIIRMINLASSGRLIVFGGGHGKVSVSQLIWPAEAAAATTAQRKGGKIMPIAKAAAAAAALWQKRTPKSAGDGKEPRLPLLVPEPALVLVPARTNHGSGGGGDDANRGSRRSGRGRSAHCLCVR